MRLALNLYPDKPKRKRWTAHEKDLVLERQKYKCAKCKKPIGGSSGELPQYDHKKSLGEGGKDIISNIQALCPSCDSKKTRVDRHKQTKKRRAAKENPLGLPSMDIKPLKLPKFKL